MGRSVRGQLALGTWRHSDPLSRERAGARAASVWRGSALGWLARSVRKLVSLSDGSMSPSSRVMNSVHIYGVVIHHQSDL
jgi:hypothetical protein